MNRIFSPDPGGLYHISQITDINGNDIFSTPVCQNEILVLKGDFTYNTRPVQQACIFVVVPTEEGFSFAEIIEWNRTEIKIKLPPYSTQGCIFLYDYLAEWNYTNCDNYVGENEIEVTDLPTPWNPPSTLPEEFNSQFEPPECDNYPGYKPIIEYIKINGDEAAYYSLGGPPDTWVPVPVWNGEEVEITFEGRLVEDVGDNYKGWTLKIHANDGTALVNVGLSANVTSYKFTPLLEQSTEFTIQLSATNRSLLRRTDLPFFSNGIFKKVSDLIFSANPRPWEEVFYVREAEIALVTVDRVKIISKMIVKKKPILKILGIEATQGVQHFNLPMLSNTTIDNNIRESNNSVDLIKNRTTVFRVYIDSGIEETINWVDQLRVDGEVDYGEDFYQHPSNGDTFIGRSRFNIDRDLLTHSLNFKIDGFFLDDNRKTFSFRVFHPDREGEDDFEDTFTLTLDFKTGYDIDVCVVLYDDKHKGHERKVNHDGRSDDDIRWDAMDVIKEHFPVPDDCIDLYLPLSGDRHKSTKKDLMRNDKEGWYRLGGDLEDLAEGYEDWDGLVWLGLTPTNSGYRLRGVGWHRNWCTHPHAVAQAKAYYSNGKAVATIPHEIVHTHHIHHTNCGDPPNIGPHLEDKIPDGRTTHTGINVYKMYLIPAESGDLMSYCSPRWCAIPLWKYLFEKIKDGA